MSKRGRNPAALALVAILLSAAPGQAEEVSLPAEDLVRRLRSARIAGIEGDQQRQLSILRNAIEAYPGEILPLHALLEVHRREPLPVGEFERTRSELSRRLADADTPLPTGVLTLMATDPEADTELQREVAAYVAGRLERDPPDRIDLLDLQAALQIEFEDLEGARDTLRARADLEPAFDVLLDLYGLHWQLEEWDEAIEVFHRLPLEEDLQIPLIQVRLLARAGRWDEMTAFLEAELAEEELTSAWIDAWRRILKTIAWDAYDADRIELARSLFTRAAAMAEEGETLEETMVHLFGSAEERVAYAAGAADRYASEEDPRTLFDGGTDLLAAGDHQGAFELLARAAPDLPDLEAAWYNLGMAAYQIEAWREAADAFARASELNPGRPDSHFFAGMAAYSLDEPGACVTGLRTALELGDERRLLHYYLAACLTRLGDLDAAAHHKRLYEAGQ